VLPKNAGGGRVGSDEFVVVFASVSTASLLELADRVRDVLSKPYSLNADSGIFVTASVGAAASEYSREGLSDLLDRADRASYEIKYACDARLFSEQVFTDCKRLNESFS
jgi:diguanylate cyclase (GGDEF)-like protein